MLKGTGLLRISLIYNEEPPIFRTMMFGGIRDSKQKSSAMRLVIFTSDLPHSVKEWRFDLAPDPLPATSFLMELCEVTGRNLILSHTGAFLLFIWEDDKRGKRENFSKGEQNKKVLRCTIELRSIELIIYAPLRMHCAHNTLKRDELRFINQVCPISRHLGVALWFPSSHSFQNKRGNTQGRSLSKKPRGFALTPLIQIQRNNTGDRSMDNDITPGKLRRVTFHKDQKSELMSEDFSFQSQESERHRSELSTERNDLKLYGLDDKYLYILNWPQMLVRVLITVLNMNIINIM
ncbi:hypothetical protein NPIL_586301 [Nephila pilipes]|uniref:Uncharacterized protein n=1 Tax=Nephila pilipes TaxID=299642 RepID=A0A8X6I3I7_NEPPI|nr:hypothetical protein NPIL_586301 [Nephila pilipes]